MKSIPKHLAEGDSKFFPLLISALHNIYLSSPSSFDRESIQELSAILRDNISNLDSISNEMLSYIIYKFSLAGDYKIDGAISKNVTDCLSLNEIS